MACMAQHGIVLVLFYVVCFCEVPPDCIVCQFRVWTSLLSTLFARESVPDKSGTCVSAGALKANATSAEDVCRFEMNQFRRPGEAAIVFCQRSIDLQAQPSMRRNEKRAIRICDVCPRSPCKPGSFLIGGTATFGLIIPQTKSSLAAESLEMSQIHVCP